MESSRSRIINGELRMPVDRQSERVTREASHHDLYQYGRTDYGQRISDAPSFRAIAFTGPDEHNLIDKKSGWLTVIGYYASGRTGDNGARWICRCVCGSYSIFSTSALKRDRPKNDPLKCARCMHHNRVVGKAAFRVPKGEVSYFQRMKYEADRDGKKCKSWPANHPQCVSIMAFLASKQNEPLPEQSCHVSRFTGLNRHYVFAALCDLAKNGYVSEHVIDDRKLWRITDAGLRILSGSVHR